MAALTDLDSDALLALCTVDNALPETSLPVIVSRNSYGGFEGVHVIDGQLVGVGGGYFDLPRIAAVIDDIYTEAARWLEAQGFAFIDNGGYRYCVDVGDGLILKAPFTDYAERQCEFEAEQEFTFPTVDRCSFVLPNGVTALLEEKLEHCGPKYGPGRYGRNMPPVPAWVNDISDGGQVGWSAQRQEWVAFDLGNEEEFYEWEEAP